MSWSAFVDGKDLNVAALFPRLQAVGSQPGAKRHILRVALLRRGDFLAVKIRSALESRDPWRTTREAPPLALRQSRARLHPAT